MKIKNYISHFLRKLGLIKCMDKVRYYIKYFETMPVRKKFEKGHPEIKLPPPYYIYETFGLDYNEFYKSKETAAWLVSYFRKFTPLNNVSVFDWGCGPGRIIRYMPMMFDESCRFYGSDYNKKYVDWCAENLPEITFKQNKLEPPLPFEDSMFDIIYGISIFTHLSEKMHYAWFNELMRVLKQGGILFITMHGKVFREKLSKSECEQFDSGKIVVLSNSKEGARTYGAFHPESFVKELAGKNDVVCFEPGGVINGKPQQDIWIFRKSSV